MAPTSGLAATNLEQQQQQQQHPSQLHGLRCPRCDSSNTKFCYYNNYSLSQPRHFCKACKRYWTRGGTLRNVPVGGGCRKNKRVKRQQPTSSLEAPNNNNTSTASTSPTSNANPRFSNPSTNTTTYTQAQMDIMSSGPSHLNPLYFGLPSNQSEMNLPFPARFNPSSSLRVSSSSMNGYDLQPHLDALGLGFSSTPTSSSPAVANNGFSSNLLFSPSCYSIFGSSSPTISTTSPTMGTLLASSFHHQKFSDKGDSDKTPFDQIQTLTGQPLDGLQVHGNNESENVLKGVKMEPRQNRQLDWSLSFNQNRQEEHHQLGFSSDPNFLYWSNGSPNQSNNPVGAWHDPANLGPSVTSLI